MLIPHAGPVFLLVPYLCVVVPLSHQGLKVIDKSAQHLKCRRDRRWRGHVDPGCLEGIKRVDRSTRFQEVEIPFRGWLTFAENLLRQGVGGGYSRGVLVHIVA